MKRTHPMPAKTPRTPTPRTKTVDLTVLWTARALQHTDTLRWFLHADMDEGSPLEAIGVRGVTPSTSLTLAFVVLRGVNRYCDPERWIVPARPAFAVLSFLNTTKYPPSLAYRVMTLGPALLARWGVEVGA